MGMTGQQAKLIKIIKELGKPAKINEIQNIYSEKFKEDIGVGIHKQIQRLVEDGYLKRVDQGKYELTSQAQAILSNKSSTEPPNINFEKKEIDEFQKFAARENSLYLLAENLNSNMVGLTRERLGVLAALISMNDTQGDRNRISVLLEGDVSSGKTSIIKWCLNNLWGFWADSDAREAALKGTGRGYQTTPGLLNKADLSVLYIDELDKMANPDQHALLGAMEDGFIPINKDGVNTILQSRIRVIATSNNRNRIIQELLSRFDLKFYVKRISQEDIDRMIRKKGNEWNREKEYINPGFLKRYMQYARQFEATLPEDRSMLNEYIIIEKNTGVLQGKDIRSIEAIYRLMLAVARLRLKKVADIEDLKVAIDLMRDDK